MDHRHLGGEAVPYGAQQAALAHARAAGEQDDGEVGAVQQVPAGPRRRPSEQPCEEALLAEEFLEPQFFTHEAPMECLPARGE